MQNVYYLQTPAIDFEPYRTSLRRFSLGLTRNMEDAEDLTQDALIRAVQNYDRLRDKQSVKIWLCRIAINLFRDKIKNKVSGETPSSNIGSPMSEGYDLETIEDNKDGISELEKKMALEPYLTTLPKAYRELVVLIGGELTYKEVAEVLSVPIGTVRSRLLRARKMLKEYGAESILQ